MYNFLNKNKKQKTKMQFINGNKREIIIFIKRVRDTLD